MKKMKNQKLKILQLVCEKHYSYNLILPDICLFVCLFVTEEILVTVSRRAPAFKEAWPSPYHY